MTAAAPSLGRFVLHTFLWLPPCFAAWYFSAKQHTAVAGGLARFLVNQLAPGVLTSMEQPGLELVFVTSIKVYPAPGQAAFLVPEVNPLVYTYGLAIFLALMLAERATWWKIPLGAALLLPFQSWGIAFDLLAQIGIRLGPEISALAGLSGWRVEGIALGYQLGFLLFPVLMPVIFWASFSRLFNESVLNAHGRDAAPAKADPG